MIGDRGHQDPVRRRIEALGSSLSLPTVRKAMGILEGEHPSGMRGNGYDTAGIRTYEPGDETRLIDWKSSAKTGRPMVVDKERQLTSKVWLLLDVGREMTGTCPSGEQAIQVAANALCMFAALSLRRSDEVSLVLADSSTITRIPCHGGFAQFEQTLDRTLLNRQSTGRNIEALLDYANRLQDRHSLLVLATDETALNGTHLDMIHRLAQTHPLSLVSVRLLNPLRVEGGPGPVYEAQTGRKVPAFLQTERTGQEVAVHREYMAAALKRELARSGSTLVRAESSQTMFNQFIHLLSVALPASSMGNPQGRPGAVSGLGRTGR